MRCSKTSPLHKLLSTDSQRIRTSNGMGCVATTSWILKMGSDNHEPPRITGTQHCQNKTRHITTTLSQLTHVHFGSASYACFARSFGTSTNWCGLSGWMMQQHATESTHTSAVTARSTGTPPPCTSTHTPCHPGRSCRALKTGSSSVAHQPCTPFPMSSTPIGLDASPQTAPVPHTTGSTVSHALYKYDRPP